MLFYIKKKNEMRGLHVELERQRERAYCTYTAYTQHARKKGTESPKFNYTLHTIFAQ